MDEKPLTVSIAAVIDSDEILLIRRERGDYTGFWALPGGKVELDEHIGGAAEREIEEETAIETEFVEYVGVVSEHLREGEVEKHYVLHVCELQPEHREAEDTEEGEGGYFECVMDQESHELVRFEEV